MKGGRKYLSLPVVVKRTDLEVDYPYLTRELGEKMGKNQIWTARALSRVGLKGDPKYHQKIRASSTSHVQRYSPAALQGLKEKLKDDPSYNPYA